MERRALRPKGWSPRATEQRMTNRTAADWVRLYQLDCPERLARPLGWLEALLVGSKVTTIDEVIAEAKRQQARTNQTIPRQEGAER
jgi:hypothetical protein